jgi:hypothetical protein
VQVKSVLFGKEVEDGGDTYVKFEGVPHVYSYTKYNFESVFPALTKLLDIQLLKDLNKDAIASLKYHTPDGDFVLTRPKGTGAEEKAKWSVKVGEEEFDAKKTVVDNILRDVTDIRGYDLTDIVMGKSEADCGLEEPSETLAISTDETADKYTILVGKSVSEDSKDRYFKIKEQAEIFIISERALSDIFKKLEDIKEAKTATPKEEEKVPTPPTEEMKTPSPKKPPLPTELKKAPPEEKRPAEVEKPKEPTGKEKPEEPAEKQKKLEAPPSPGQVEKKEEKPTAPEEEGAPSVSPPEGEKKDEGKPNAPEEAKPAPEPPTETPALQKAEKEIPAIPAPTPPAPKEPIPLPPSPEGSRNK